MGLYGPDGALARFTRAAQDIRTVAEKLRDQQMRSKEAQVKVVAEAFAATEGGTDYFIRAARAAIIALDEVRVR